VARDLRTYLLVIALALTFGACAAADERPTKQVWYEERLDFLTTHPYAFTCGDERGVNRFGKRTYFALADIVHFEHMSRLRAAHSIFYAVEEVCRGKPGSFWPIRLAIAGVRSGKWVSRQGNAGNDADHGVNRRVSR
jgi:hypothetical protein